MFDYNEEELARLDNAKLLTPTTVVVCVISLVILGVMIAAFIN